MNPAIDALGTKLTTRKQPDRILSHRACHPSRRPAGRGGSTGRTAGRGSCGSIGGSIGRSIGRSTGRGGCAGRAGRAGRSSTGRAAWANSAASDTEAITKENLIRCVSVGLQRGCIGRSPPRVFVPKANI